jgi:hypothetical protein
MLVIDRRRVPSVKVAPAREMMRRDESDRESNAWKRKVQTVVRQAKAVLNVHMISGLMRMDNELF